MLNTMEQTYLDAWIRYAAKGLVVEHPDADEAVAADNMRIWIEGLIDRLVERAGGPPAQPSLFDDLTPPSR